MFPEFEVCNTTISTITEEPFSRYSESFWSTFSCGFEKINTMFLSGRQRIMISPKIYLHNNIYNRHRTYIQHSYNHIH